MDNIHLASPQSYSPSSKRVSRVRLTNGLDNYKARSQIERPAGERGSRQEHWWRREARCVSIPYLPSTECVQPKILLPPMLLGAACLFHIQSPWPFLPHYFEMRRQAIREHAVVHLGSMQTSAGRQQMQPQPHHRPTKLPFQH